MYQRIFQIYISLQSGSQNASTPTQSESTNVRRVWRLCPFRNPARSDGLVLKHWQQVELKNENTKNNTNELHGINASYAPTLDSDITSTLPKVDEETNVVDTYTFAKIAPAIKVYRYSDDFYRYHIVDLDPSWTKEETDLLFDLCEMFELRFIAIHDRFKWRKEITLEKLKHRYYAVTKRIVEFSFEEKIKVEMAKHNNPNHPVVVALREEMTRHPLVKYVYNMEHDRERRIMLERSFRITEEQKQEESQLLDDIKEAESLFKKEERKKNELRKLKRKFNVIEDAIPSPSIGQLHSKDVWLASDIVTSYKAQIPSKHNDAVDEMLAALNISAPVVSSRASNELYCVVRGDAAIMINLVNKVDSLKRELDHWRAIAGPLPEQIGTPKSKDEKPVVNQETSDLPSVFQTPRPIMPPKVFPKPKPPMPQQGSSEETTQASEPAKQFSEQQQQDSQNNAIMFQQQMARQRMMMAQQGPPRPQMQQMYPMKLSPSGNSSPHSFQQQGPYGHMMQHQTPQHVNQPQHMGQQSPIAKQRPAMHQMMQQGMHPSHPMMQQHRVPPQRMMQYPQYSQQSYQPGFQQQQFAPMPMRVHPQGVYYTNQMYPQAHFGHMMQHPMPHTQTGMHQMGQTPQMQPQIQGQPQAQIQGQVASHMQGQMPGHMQHMIGQQGTQHAISQQPVASKSQQMSPNQTRSM